MEEQREEPLLLEEVVGDVDGAAEVGVLGCCEGLLVLVLRSVVVLGPYEDVMKSVGEVELPVPLGIELEVSDAGMEEFALETEGPHGMIEPPGP